MKKYCCNCVYEVWPGTCRVEARKVISLVSGKVELEGKHVCWIMRTSSFPCGPEGKLFKPKPWWRLW